MTNREIAEKCFTNYITTTFKTNENAMRYFLNHENKPKVIDGICREILSAELSPKYNGKFLNRARVEQIATEATKLFCHVALAIAKSRVDGKRPEEVKGSKPIDGLVDKFGNPF